MRVLVIGSGGREHALVWKIAQSKLVDKIFCAPGNAGIAKQAECIDIKADDILGLLEFARKERIDLTVVGPEVPLTLGIVDEFNKYKLRIFGPSKLAAQLEGSKIFSKELMAKYKIPTAEFKVFDNAGDAKSYIEKRGSPCVVKADGLAAGKGVVVAKTVDEAKEAVEMMMTKKAFGAAGSRVIVEECLLGQEASILAITDSKSVITLASSQDHKTVDDNDEGPNTGGMGAYSPAPIVTSSLYKEINDKIIHKTIDGLAREGIEYKGVLYAGVMITKNGPYTLEFNVRFGDPETEAILPRIKSDLVEVMLATCDVTLSKVVKSGGITWDNRACVCVVASSKGYPAEYEKGKVITGLDEVEKMQDAICFHAGTKKAAVNGKDQIVTNGGRVLGITGLGNSIKDAISHTYKAVEKISFDGMHYRRDIGQKALRF